MKILLHAAVFLFLVCSLGLANNRDTAYVDSLYEISFELRRTKIDSGYSLARYAYQLSDSLKYDKGKAKSLKLISIYNWIKGRYRQAIDTAYMSLRLFEKVGDKNGVASVYNNISLIHIAQDEFDEALKLLKIADKLAKESKDTLLIAKTNMNIGLVKSFQKDYDQALDYMKIALPLFKKLKKRNGVADCYAYIGRTFNFQKQLDSAQYYLEKSYSIYDSLANERGVIMVSNFLSKNYSDMKNFRKSNEIALEGIKLAEKLDVRFDIFDIGVTIAKNYADLNDHKQAYKYLKKSQELFEILRDEDISKKITQLKLEYEFEKKMNKIEHEQEEKELLAEAQMKRQNLMIWAISAVLILVLVITLLLWLNSKKKTKMNHILREKNEQISRQHDELEKKNEQLRELNATKDKFFSIIAHDLRNPLGAFRDVTGLLRNESHSLTENEKSEFIELINDSAVTLFDLLSNLLTWARSQRGKIDLNPIHADISIIAQNNIDLMKAHAQKKNIEIISEIPENTFAQVDGNLITTVFRNIISNAIKFTNDGGFVKIYSRADENFVEITIEDNGVGMKPEKAENLFLIDKSHKSKGTHGEEGTGLGLIICKEFIEKHGGTIRAESQPDKGSKFIFTLPKS